MWPNPRFSADLVTFTEEILNRISFFVQWQKQNETYLRIFKTKVADSMIFAIHCNIFFQQTSSFVKFSVKASYEKTERYKLQIYLQTSSWQKFDLSRSTSSKNRDQMKIILASSQFTCDQHQALHQIQQQIYKFLLCVFLFT